MGRRQDLTKIEVLFPNLLACMTRIKYRQINKPSGPVYYKSLYTILTPLIKLCVDPCFTRVCGPDDRINGARSAADSYSVVASFVGLFLGQGGLNSRNEKHVRCYGARKFSQQSPANLVSSLLLILRAV